jgi:hypothetical protein
MFVHVVEGMKLLEHYLGDTSHHLALKLIYFTVLKRIYNFQRCILYHLITPTKYTRKVHNTSKCPEFLNHV